MGFDARKPVFGVCEQNRSRRNPVFGVGNYKDADQPARQRSLVSAFVIRYLESIVVKHVTYEISIF